MTEISERINFSMIGAENAGSNQKPCSAWVVKRYWRRFVIVGLFLLPRLGRLPLNSTPGYKAVNALK